MQSILDHFTSMVQLHGLEIEIEHFEPQPQDEGMCSASREYEGGFVITQIRKGFTNNITLECCH